MSIQNLIQLIQENPQVASSIASGKKPKKTITKKEEIDLLQQFNKKLENAIASLPKPKDGKTPTRQELESIISGLIPSKQMLQTLAEEAATKTAQKLATITSPVEKTTTDKQLAAEIKSLQENLKTIQKSQKQALSKIGSGYSDSDVQRLLNRKGYIVANSIVYVQEASQLAGTLRSDVVYFIDGFIDMGTTQITVPSGGLTLAGASFFINGLFSTADNYTMFVDNGTAGNLKMQDMEVSTSGTNSKLSSLHNQGNGGAVEILDCNIGSFARTTTSFGELSGYRQVRFDGCGFFNYSDGFTLSGTMSGGLAVTDSIAILAGSGSTLFKEGTSLVINGSSTSNIHASSGANAANAVIWDLQPSNITNDGSFVLSNARFGNLTNPLPNMPENSVKVKYTDCIGIRNTFIGAIWQLTTETATSLVADTMTKLEGTTTYDQLVYFTGNGNNRLTYISSQERDFAISGTAVLEGGIGFAGDTLQLTVRQWDDSASSYLDLTSYIKTVPNSIGVAEQVDISFFSYATLSQNDAIELWVTNIGASTNATLTQASFLKITPRS